MEDSENLGSVRLYHTPNNQEIFSRLVLSEKLIAKLPSAAASKNQVPPAQQLGDVFLVISMAAGGVGEIELVICWPHPSKLHARKPLASETRYWADKPIMT